MSALRHSLGLATMLGLALSTLASPAKAQISGAYDYDANNRAYFITGDTTIYGNIGVNPATGLPFSDEAFYKGNDVFVGKDNATSFSTLPNVLPIVLDVNGAPNGPFGTPVGAVITYSNRRYPYSTVYNPNASSYPGLNVFGANIANINGGDITLASTWETGRLNIRSGFVQSAVGHNSGTVNISGGTLTAGVSGKDSSTVNINGGYVANADSYDNSHINITAGTVNTTHTQNNSSRVDINGGTVDKATGTAGITNIYQGSVQNAVSSMASSMNIHGGNINIAQSENNSLLTIDGGTVTSAYGYNTSIVRVNGGVVSKLYGRSDSTLHMSGGQVIDVYLFENSVFDITGGKLGKNTIRLFDNSLVNISGTDLALALIGAGTDANGSYIGYMLSGTLLDGESISGVSIHDYDGGASIGNPNQGTGNVRFLSAVAVPEQGTLTLLALILPTALIISRRRCTK